MKQDKRSIKHFRCWLVESKQYVYDIQKICDGKLIKSFAEILNNPEKYVVEQETGAIDIVKNKIREGDIATRTISAKFLSGNMASWFSKIVALSCTTQSLLEEK